ncbi:MAG: YdcF family protein [Actinomycetota bacterium]
MNDRAEPSLPERDLDLAARADDETGVVDRRESETPVSRDGGDGPDVATSGHARVVAFRWRNRVVRGAALVVLVGVCYYAISVVQVWSTGRSDDRDPVDAIVVMGAAQFDGRPSPQLEARLDHVLVLWPEAIAPLVVTTGGNLPGDRFTEAESSANYLAERGVPEDAILLEDRGGTTYESMEGVAELLDARGLDEVVIVTDPYHALRSRLIAESVGLDASVSSTTTSVVTGGSSLRRHLVEGAGVAVGRIVGFERLDAWTN